MLVDDFRKNVEAILKVKRMRRTDLADRLNCTRAYVTQVLNGYHDPGLGVVQKWAKALRVDAYTLLSKKMTQEDWRKVL